MDGEHLCEDPASDSDGPKNEASKRTKIPFRSKVTLAVLVFINLLNYMDRYTIASVLTKIQDYFSINSKIAGLLNTVFVCSYMAFAPIFGYLGDRYTRKYVMAVGILIWTITTLAGSFTERNQFWYFFLTRGLVGIGEASYSTVAPTIIADLFVGDRRTGALSCFYFAIPCGSALGYIVGSEVAGLINNNWKWALRVTPPLGGLCIILCICVIQEPKRGEIEAAPVTSQDECVGDDTSVSVIHQATDYRTDLAYLWKVKSFVWATVGNTFMSFSLGGMAFWIPEFATFSQRVQGIDAQITSVSYKFGIITFVAGVLGVLIGSESARRYKRINRKAEALVCAFGMLLSVPFTYFALVLADRQIIVTWVLVAFSEIFLFLNWTPNADLLLGVIIPSRRSTAEAVQILIMHLLGDASSPFIIGAIVDAVQGHDQSDASRHKALLYGLLITPFFCVASSIGYFISGQYLPRDRDIAEAFVKGAIEESMDSIANQEDDKLEAEAQDDAPVNDVEIDYDGTDRLLPVVDICR